MMFNHTSHIVKVEPKHLDGSIAIDHLIRHLESNYGEEEIDWDISFYWLDRELTRVRMFVHFRDPKTAMLFKLESYGDHLDAQ